MEASGANSDAYRGASSTSSNSRRYGMHLSASNFFHSPLSTLLQYSGILHTHRSSHPETHRLVNTGAFVGFSDHIQATRLDDSTSSANGGEVSIRIIGAGELEHERVGIVLPSPAVGFVQAQGEVSEAASQVEAFVQPMSGTPSATVVAPALDAEGGSRSNHGTLDGVSQSMNASVDAETADRAGVNNRDTSYQRYDIQHAARCIEQVLPFSLLLLVIFIRQHLQGFLVTIWIAAVMFKSNDILWKQTALKGERRLPILIGFSFVFMLHVVGIYWWYRNDDLLYPLVMLPPRVIPPF